MHKDICTKTTYEKNGESKTIWNKIGTIFVSPDGKMFMKLFMHPDTSFYIFDQKQKEAF